MWGVPFEKFGLLLWMWPAAWKLLPASKTQTGCGLSFKRSGGLIKESTMEPSPAHARAAITQTRRFISCPDPPWLMISAERAESAQIHLIQFGAQPRA